MLNLIYGTTLTSVHGYLKNHSFDYMDLCQQSESLLFNIYLCYLYLSQCPRVHSLKYLIDNAKLSFKKLNNYSPIASFPIICNSSSKCWFLFPFFPLFLLAYMCVYVMCGVCISLIDVWKLSTYSECIIKLIDIKYFPHFWFWTWISFSSSFHQISSKILLGRLLDSVFFFERSYYWNM